MAYVSQEDKKEIAVVVKSILTKYGLKGSLRVRHHSALVLTIRSGKIDFFNNYNETRSNKNYNDNFEPVTKSSMSVNTHYVKDNFSCKAKDALSELTNALKGPKYFDHSDSMTDYFHCSHYIDIKIGEYDKPYILTN